MQLIKRNKLKFILSIAVLLLLTMFITTYAILGDVKAAYTPVDPGTKITFTFEVGKYYDYQVKSKSGDTAAPNELRTAQYTFDGGTSTTRTATVNDAGCVIMPISDFTTGLNAVYSGLDGYGKEYGYFGEKVDGTVTSTNNSLWAFTGFQIKGTEPDERIPGQTVFQPGDTITPEVLAEHAADGAIELEAVWGNVFVVNSTYGASNPGSFKLENNKYVLEDKKYPYTNYSTGAATGDYTLASYRTDASGNEITMWEMNFFTLSDGVYTNNHPATLTNTYSNLRDGGSIGGALVTIDGAYARIHKFNRANSWRSELNMLNDAYSTVIMLDGGDVYYYQKNNGGADEFGYNNVTKGLEDEGVDIAVTFKSRSDTTRTIYYKSEGLATGVSHNIRFDNINLIRANDSSDPDFATEQIDGSNDNYFGEVIGYEWFFYDNSNPDVTSYVEMTSRFNVTGSDGYVKTNRKEAIREFRVYGRDYTVINGGGYNSFHTMYGDDVTEDSWVNRSVKIGGTAGFKNTCFLGAQSDNAAAAACETVGNWDFYMTGGFIYNIQGGNNSTQSICVGHRNMYFLGDTTADTTQSVKRWLSLNTSWDERTIKQYRPFVRDSIAGNDGSRLFGNVNIKIYGTDIDGSVYGGGYEATGTVYGDVYVDIDASTIGDGSGVDAVYGGGYNGNVEKVPTTYSYYKNQKVNSDGVFDASGSNTEIFEYKYNLQGTGAATDYPETTGDEDSTANLITLFGGTSAAGKNRPLAGLDYILDKAHSHNGKDFGTWTIGSGGHVYMDIDNCTITGEVHGSGSGGTRTYWVSSRHYPAPPIVDLATYKANTSTYATSGCYIKYDASATEKTGYWIFPAEVQTWYDTTPSGFPEMNGDDVLINVTKSFGWNGRTLNEFTWMTNYQYAQLSVAQVDSVDMEIHGTTVTGSVYGGGNTANVNGDINILIDQECEISGSVYGGGQGTAPANVTVYQYSSSTAYTKPSITPAEYNDEGLPVSVTVKDSSGGSTSASCAWTNESSLASKGADLSTGKIYSKNYGNYGLVTGNITLKIDNSTVKSNVYGGGNAGDVKGTVNVEVTGSEITGNEVGIFGGGYSASSEVGGKITLKVTDTVVSQSIYGGSYNGSVKDIDLTVAGTTSSIDVYGGSLAGKVSGEINVWFKDQATAQRVYGGGYKSNYSGTPNLYVQGGSNIDVGNDGVYGGSAYGTVGGTNVIITGGNLTRVFGGGNYVGSNVTGNVNVKMTGGTTNWFNGGSKQGTVTGNVTVNISENAIVCQGGGDSLYGGGYQGDVGGDINLTIDVDIDVLSSTSIVGIYGGGDSGNVGGDITMNIDGQTISASNTTGAYIYGGCKNANVSGNATVNLTDSTVNGWVYGANNQGGSVTNTNVNLTNTYVTSNVFGGGSNVTTGTAVTGTANVTIDCTDTAKLPVAAADSGDSSRPVTNRKTVYGGSDTSGDVANTKVILKGYAKVGDQTDSEYYEERVYGGGNQAAVTGTATVQLAGNAYVRGDVYGGGKSATVLGNTTVDLIDNSFARLYVYGGGESGAVGSSSTPANTYVNISGNATAYSYVLGGCNLADGIVYGDTHVNISGGRVGRSDGGEYVFGGGNQAKTDGNTYVNITGGNISGRIFGGANNADVTGTANITVSGGTLDYDNSDPENELVFYGGCNSSGTVSNGTNIEITDTVGYRRVYGGGLGADTTVSGTATVTVNDPDASGLSYVFGGSRNGKVQNSVVNVNSTPVQNVFGGSDGATSSTTGSITVNVNGSTANYVYGGGNDGPVNGNIDVNITNSSKIGANNTTASDTRNDCLFGGGNNADVTGDIIVKVTDSYIGKEGNDNYTYQAAYGGGNNGVVTGNTKFTVAGNSCFYGAVFGGGNNGDVIGNTTVDLEGTGDSSKVNVYGNVYGGGNNADVSQKAIVNAKSGYVEKDIYAGGKGAVVKVASEVNFTGGEARSVYGGGEGSNATVYVATVNFSGGTAKNIYGGGYSGQVTTDTNVNITGGTVTNDVAGGGYGQTATVNGNANLDISGETTTLGDGSMSTDFDLICGGGYNGIVKGDVIVTTTGTDTYPVFNGAFYCGAFKGNIEGNITGNIGGGDFNYNFYGGSQSADVGTEGDPLTGDIIVTHTGGVHGPSLTLGGNNLSGTIYGTVRHTLQGGTFANVYGGSNGNGNQTGDFTGTIPGAETKGSVALTVTGTADVQGTVYCGDNDKGVIRGEINGLIDAPVNTVDGWGVLAGGYAADHNGKATVEVTANGSCKTLHGGGNKAYVKDAVVILNGTANQVYGGGSLANISTSYVNINGTVEENVFGGGYSGTAGITNVVVAENGNVTLNVYGGGNLADVDEASVTISSGKVNGNVYGAGKGETTHTGSANILIEKQASTVSGNVYGGGENGTANGTYVEITGGNIGYETSVSTFDTETQAQTVTVDGNVFGGGQGETATVYNKTEVVINTDHEFNAVEETVYVDEQTKLSSGQISTTISSDNCDEFIYGNVYGGGDLGRVGEGSIITGANRANITTEGKTKVTVMNGHIVGSVFGGGRGIPAEGVDYNIRMGTVFGSTDTNIYGGYIGKNIYGGGEQSRVYAKDNGLATDVDINCLESPINQIAIGGSVFGGGDRGSGDAINASVPTTVGDVEVTVTGSTVPNEVKGGRTPIYFLSGGIYGDGNLCLASGNRTITIKDFGIGNDNENGTMLKTFYSVQRADEVYLDNSDIVLLGAIDLVEEGDETLYSINRVGELYMTNGSTFKLDNIVKYLGGLYSDYKDYDETNLRQFIHLGNNGTNDYQSHGCIGNDLTVLTDQEIVTYRYNDVNHEGDYAEHNTVCVANGLYLEIMNENDEYGPVKGLFTLELLFSNPGEGGGFVYGSIEQSTGDFICTTEMESSITGEVVYMDIIDNVGKTYDESDFSYYYWYIAGDTINYILNVKGYVGTDQTEFSDSVTIPTHTGSYWYILESIVGDTDLEDYIKANNIDIVQTTDVKDKTDTANSQMAVEVKISGQTMGFLTYDSSAADTNKWGLYVSGLDTTVYGMQGVKEEDDGYAGQLMLNRIRALEPMAEGENNVEFVLHKASDIDAVTTEDLNIDMVVKMFDNFWQPPQNDTHTLAFDAAFTVRRINPTQSVFFEAVKSYVGVSTQSPIRINEFSAFSADFTTRYVPRTFTQDTDSSMTWSISSASVLPAGTKITMVDLSGTTPSYYYYICEGNATTSVDLTDFKQMGTETGIADLATAPAFISLYNSQVTDIATERLLFVFDFEQATGWEAGWSKVDNTITLNHTYDTKEIMDYKDENNVQKAPLTVEYEVNNDTEGVATFTIDFDQAEYPDKCVAEIDVSLLENDIVDTRYYEGAFGMKLELVDASGNVLSMPNGITFTVNGKTYLPGIENNYAVVGLDTFGTYTVTMDTGMFGIQEVLGTNSNTVKLKASLYSAPEATYYNSIDTAKTDDAQYTVTDVYPAYHLRVKTDNTATNLIMGDGKGEDLLSFTIQTKADNDTTTLVSVAAYSKDGKNSYTESIDLSKLFTNANTVLPISEDAATSYEWVLADGVQPGTYRVVFTYGARTEYVYFIVA